MAHTTKRKQRRDNRSRALIKMSDKNVSLSRRRFSHRAALTGTGLSVSTLVGTPTIAAHAAASAAVGSAAPEFVVPKRLQSHLQQLFGDRKISQQGVTLDMPALAENGNSVALGLRLQAADPQNPIVRLYLFAEKNPLPDIARFVFSDQASQRELAVRIRLADSQQLVGIAETRNGELQGGTASVIVTLAACIDIPL